MAQFIVRLTLDSNAIGPFDIYTGSTSTTPIKVNQTRDQLTAGVVISLPGSTFGTQYTILVVNTQDGCNDLLVTHTVTAYTSYVITTNVAEGSTIATYSVVASERATENITVNFKNTLGVSSGSPVIFYPAIPIASGSTTGSLVLTASTEYNLLDETCVNTDFYISGATGVITIPPHIFNCNFVNITPTPSSTPNVTPTPTASGIFITPTPTNTPSGTPNVTPTNTPSSTPNATPNVTPTNTPSNTPSSTPNATPNVTPTNTPSNTPSSTPNATPNVTPTNTPSNTPSGTPNVTPTNTPSGTPNVTPTNTPSGTPNVTPTNTQTPSGTPNVTPTNTPSGTPNVTPTNTPSNTPSGTPNVTPTNTQTPSGTPNVTPTNTPSGTPNVTPTNTPSGTPNVTPTNTPSGTPNVTPSVTPTNTQTPSGTPNVTPTNTPSGTPNVTPTNTPSGTPNVTPTNTPSGTPNVTPTNTPSNTPSGTPNVTPTNTPSGTPNVTPTNTPSGTPNVTPTPTITPSAAGASPMLLFMEASSDAVFGGDQNIDIGDWMVNNGTGNWYGYITSGEPDLSDANQLADFKTWMDWPGFTTGTTNAPAVITSVVSQTATGTDSYGNNNGQYIFQTLEIPSGSFTTNDIVWFVFVVPHSELANSTKLYTSIGYDFSSTPSNAVSQKTLATSLSKNYNVVYGSSNWDNTTYRVHGNTGTLQRTISAADQSNDFYFRGGDLT